MCDMPCQDEIANKFNGLRNIWQCNDKWHWYTHKKITKYINFTFKRENISKESYILNAGSGGNDYGLKDFKIMHLDIAKEKIKKFPKYILSSIEKIPLEKNSFDFCICVGSVINYCSAEIAIKEISRVLKPRSRFILEFEKTNSWELLGSDNFNKTLAIIDTFYNYQPEKLWAYNEKYILNILERNNFDVNSFERFHLISPMIYKIFKSENFSSYFAKMDPFFRLIPLIKLYSSNIILTCERKS
jgi:SAM-dependent methyltransferase